MTARIAYVVLTVFMTLLLIAAMVAGLPGVQKSGVSFGLMLALFWMICFRSSVDGVWRTAVRRWIEVGIAVLIGIAVLVVDFNHEVALGAVVGLLIINLLDLTIGARR